MAIPMLTDSAGSKSASFTMLIISFTAITLWFLLSIFGKLGHIDIRPFDGTTAMLYFVPIAGLYFGRKGQQIGAAGDPDASNAAK